MANNQKKYTEKRKPEDDRNNVAYYKKKSNVEPTDQDVKDVKLQPEKSKLWSQIVKTCPTSTPSRPEKGQTTWIKPEFNSENLGYDRIVISPTHLNNKPISGFITENDAETICAAIGLKEIENHHGTSFYRNEDDVLFVTYKLKQTMSKHEITNTLNKYFWFEKESKAGSIDTISGHVVHPPMGDNRDGIERDLLGNATYGANSGNVDDTKELRIDGCNYEISENELRKWIDLYGKIKSDIEELAAPGGCDGEPVGMGSYMVKVRMKNSIPHILPIGGLKVKCTYIGVKKQCKNCYEYHTSKRTERIKKGELLM